MSGCLLYHTTPAEAFSVIRQAPRLSAPLCHWGSNRDGIGQLITGTMYVSATEMMPPNCGHYAVGTSRLALGYCGKLPIGQLVTYTRVPRRHSRDDAFI